MLFSSLPYPRINAQVDKMIVLIPLGAIEQHGPHLAVSTDTDLVSGVAKQVEMNLPDDILLCPTLQFGSSHHHLAFGGTLSLSIATYTQILVELVESLLTNGFRRIVLLNGHGGNITPGKQAMAILSHKYDALLRPNIVFATYWELAPHAFAGQPPMESPALSHACEYETSMLLYLFPDKVFPDQIQRAKRPARNGYIPFEDDETPGGVAMVKQTQFISSNGSSGEPQLGTRDKGKYLFDAAVKALTNFITHFKSWPFLEDLKINSDEKDRD
jgi:creatinine amidohydrolase